MRSMKPDERSPLIDEQAARLFERDEDVERAKNVAFRLLAARPRSRNELVQRLRGKHFQKTTIEGAVEALVRLGMLDDRAFAQGWVEHRLNARPTGRKALERELRDKGVASDVAVQVLDEMFAGRDPGEEALSLLRTRERQYRGLDRQKAMSRMYGLLGRRGFDAEAARAAAQKMWREIERDAG